MDKEYKKLVKQVGKAEDAMKKAREKITADIKTIVKTQKFACLNQTKHECVNEYIAKCERFSDEKYCDFIDCRYCANNQKYFEAYNKYTRLKDLQREYFLCEFQNNKK